MSEHTAKKEEGLNQAPTPKQRADTLRGISPEVVAQARSEGQKLTQAGVRNKGDVPTTKLQSPTPVAGGSQSAPATREQFIEKDGVGHPNGGYGNAGAKQTTPAVEQTTETTAQKPDKAPSPEAQKALGDRMKQVEVAGQEMKKAGLQPKEAERGAARPTPNPPQKGRGDGPDR
jgi:hypothetical protein